MGAQLLFHRSTQGCHRVPGSAALLNTWDAFRDSDKAAVLQQAAAAVWRDICSGRAEANPSLLSRFTLLCFADLKQFRFHSLFFFSFTLQH